MISNRLEQMEESFLDLLATLERGSDSCQAAGATAEAIKAGPWYAENHRILSQALIDLLERVSKDLLSARKECHECREELRRYGVEEVQK